MGTTQEPSVGIGLPTYNRAAYLKLAIDSFLAQTYKNVVVVVCDNVSTDGTQKMCEEYARRDQRVRYLRHAKHLTRDGNATFALQQIVHVADLCMMTSDDDVAEPEFIKACVDALLADPAAGMAITHHNTVYWGTTRRLEKDPRRYIPTQKELYQRLKQYTLFYSHDERSFCMSGVFRKNMVEHEFFEDKTESDVNFALRCLSRGYFLDASDRILFHKGVIPGIGKESIRSMPFGLEKIRRAAVARLSRAGSEFRNTAFLAGVPELSPWQKMKLVFWNLVIVIRLFTSVKV